MFSVVLFFYATAYLSQGLYTIFATAISKHVAIKVYKKSYLTEMYSDTVPTLKREITLDVVIFNTYYSYQLGKKHNQHSFVKINSICRRNYCRLLPDFDKTLHLR
jgi:hypothetical protein